MSHSTTALTTALETVKQATQLDASGKYNDALRLYLASLSHFEAALSSTEENQQLKKLIAEKMGEYSRRADLIKQFLVREQLPSPSSPKPSTEAAEPTQAPSPVSSPQQHKETPLSPQGEQKKSNSGPLPKHLSFNWSAAMPNEKLIAGMRKWHFVWNSQHQQPPVQGTRPFLRSTFNLTAVPKETRDGFIVELGGHQLQRFSETEGKWDAPLDVGNTLRVAFHVNSEGHFQHCPHPFNESIEAEGVEKQWRTWVQEWIGTDISQTEQTFGGGDEELLVEQKLQHWGKPCLKLKKTKQWESKGVMSCVVYEATVEWTTLRPHTATITLCTLSPPAQQGAKGNAHMEKQFFVFGWKDVVCASTDFCLPSTHYDEEFEKEIITNISDICEHVQFPIFDKKEPVKEEKKIMHQDIPTSPVATTTDSSSPQDKNASGKELLQPNIGGFDTDRAANIHATRATETEGTRAIRETAPQATTLPSKPSAPTNPIAAVVQPTLPALDSKPTANQAVPLQPQPQPHYQQQPEKYAPPSPQQAYHQLPASVNSQHPGLTGAAFAEGGSYEIPNSVLLGEIQLLRHELSLMKQIVFGEILALKSLVKENIALHQGHATSGAAPLSGAVRQGTVPPQAWDGSTLQAPSPLHRPSALAPSSPSSSSSSSSSFLPTSSSPALFHPSPHHHHHSLVLGSPPHSASSGLPPYSAHQFAAANYPHSTGK